VSRQSYNAVPFVTMEQKKICNRGKGYILFCNINKDRGKSYILFCNINKDRGKSYILFCNINKDRGKNSI
jgi:hypothetical protein